MTRALIPEEIRAFVLARIPSVPYLEAVLLMRSFPAGGWTAAQLARRLYLGERTAQELLQRLCRDGIAARTDAPHCYVYRPESGALRDMLDRLAVCYGSNLVGISNLIHAQPIDSRPEPAPVAPKSERLS